MSDVIQTGKAYRILADSSKQIWNKISFWRKASDVYNEGNENLQKTVGVITGITDSLISTSDTVCASAKAIKDLNDKLVAIETQYS